MTKWTLRVKNFFKEKVFHHFFWTLIRKRADFVSVFTPALTKLQLRVHRNVLTKTDDFWKGYFFPGSLYENFWTFDGVFPPVCQNNIQSVQRKALRGLLLGKYFKSISHSLRNLQWAFQNWILCVERPILRKTVYYFGNPRLCYSISALEQKQSAVFPKYIGKLRLKLH